MSNESSKLPPCGLYRTGRPLKGQEKEIPAGVLVMFHNHSNRNIPMLQLPRENTHNVWSFHEQGPGIEDDDAFIEALQPVLDQGFYHLREELQTPDGRFPKYSLVQLGYNMSADPILFIAQRSSDTNSLFFAETGYRFEQLDILKKLGPEQAMWFTGAPQDQHAAHTGGELLN
ncbi:MAG: hypothetical protein H6727_12490 [Myxococcales bacterium]|nr:hypothetical protein [Myxococcales bacterium]